MSGWVIFVKVAVLMASSTTQSHVVRGWIVSVQMPRCTISQACVAGEVCKDWETWSDYLHIKSVFVHSLLQAFVYVALAVSDRPPTTHCSLRNFV